MRSRIFGAWAIMIAGSMWRGRCGDAPRESGAPKACTDGRQCAGQECVDGVCCADVWQAFGPSDWPKGAIVQDTFDWTIPNLCTGAATQGCLDPKDPNLSRVRVLVGVWRGQARLAIKNAEASDAEQRANVIALPTGIRWVDPAASSTQPAGHSPR